jgi:hypothetical protein
VCLDKRQPKLVPGILYIDPPDGWRFGFPKAMPLDLEAEARPAWLVEQGYPAHLANDPNLMCRYYYLEPP